MSNCMNSYAKKCQPGHTSSLLIFPSPLTKSNHLSSSKNFTQLNLDGDSCTKHHSSIRYNTLSHRMVSKKWESTQVSKMRQWLQLLQAGDKLGRDNYFPCQHTPICFVHDKGRGGTGLTRKHQEIQQHLLEDNKGWGDTALR